MTTEQKCRGIVESIVALCAADGLGVKFQPDWGGNSLTVCIDGGHTHVGDPDEWSFEELVDGLHDLLVDGRGLSLVDDQAQK